MNMKVQVEFSKMVEKKDLKITDCESESRILETNSNKIEDELEKVKVFFAK